MTVREKMYLQARHKLQEELKTCMRLREDLLALVPYGPHGAEYRSALASDAMHYLKCAGLKVFGCDPDEDTQILEALSSHSKGGDHAIVVCPAGAIRLSRVALYCGCGSSESRMFRLFVECKGFIDWHPDLGEPRKIKFSSKHFGRNP